MSKINKSSEKQPLEPYPYGQLLDYGGKIVAMLSAAVGGAYAIGFVITNIYLLTKYGIYDFEVIKTRYILTGFFFSILAYIAFVISLGILKATDASKKKIIKIIIGIVATLFFAGFMGTIIKGVTSWVVESYTELAVISTFIRIWSLLAISTTIAIILFVRGGGWKKEGINIPVPYSIFTSVLLLAGAYSQLVYPVLPIALGGGNPVPIQLVVDETNAELISTLIPFSDDVTTEQVYLIDQSSSSYFVLIPSSVGVRGRAIEIRKDYIVSIIHFTEENVPLSRIDPSNSTAEPTNTPTSQITPTP